MKFFCGLDKLCAISFGLAVDRCFVAMSYFLLISCSAGARRISIDSTAVGDVRLSQTESGN